MGNRLPTLLLLIAAVIALTAIGTFAVLRSHEPLKIRKIVLPMPKENLAAPKEFLDGYHQYQELAGQMKSIGDALSPAIPKGYTFDEATESFAPQKPPVVTPGPVTPPAEKK